MSDGNGLTGLELRNTLNTPLRLSDNAEQRYSQPEMSERCAPGGARKTFRPRVRGCQRHLEQSRTLGDFSQSAGHDEYG